MKVLILGAEAHEHALAWAVKKSERVTEVVCAPGNGGMAQMARCLPVNVGDLEAMVALVEAERPELTVVGPEVPLSLGIVDVLGRSGVSEHLGRRRMLRCWRRARALRSAFCSGIRFPRRLMRCA